MLYDTLFLIKDQMVTSDSSYFFLKIFIFKKLIFFFFNKRSNINALGKSSTPNFYKFRSFI